MLSRMIRAPAAVRPLRLTRPALARPFHNSRKAQALHEDDLHKDSEETKEEIESHKQDQLQKQKDGKGHWKPELASASEAAVKADREEIVASEENIRKMQDETAKQASKK